MKVYGRPVEWVGVTEVRVLDPDNGNAQIQAPELTFGHLWSTDYLQEGEPEGLVDDGSSPSYYAVCLRGGRDDDAVYADIDCLDAESASWVEAMADYAVRAHAFLQQSQGPGAIDSVEMEACIAIATKLGIAALTSPMDVRERVLTGGDDPAQCVVHSDEPARWVDMPPGQGDRAVAYVALRQTGGGSPSLVTLDPLSLRRVLRLDAQVRGHAALIQKMKDGLHADGQAARLVASLAADHDLAAVLGPDGDLQEILAQSIGLAERIEQADSVEQIAACLRAPAEGSVIDRLPLMGRLQAASLAERIFAERQDSRPRP